MGQDTGIASDIDWEMTMDDEAKKILKAISNGIGFLVMMVLLILACLIVQTCQGM